MFIAWVLYPYWSPGATARVSRQMFPQFPDFLPRGELLKRLAALPVLQVGAQHFFHGLWQFRRAHPGKNLAADGLLFSKSAPDENVICIHAFAAQTADVTHGMDHPALARQAVEPGGGNLHRAMRIRLRAVTRPAGLIWPGAKFDKAPHQR